MHIPLVSDQTISWPTQNKLTMLPCDVAQQILVYTMWPNQFVHSSPICCAQRIQYTCPLTFLTPALK